MTQECWICGAKADSAEHRLKKSDLLRAYGCGPYKGTTGPYHFREDNATLIQGPGSRAIKYSHSLCQHCNTTYTQPFDSAYDRFIDWIMKNEEVVLHRRFVDFHEVYGNCWENTQRDLYKYFAKSFGCRLVDAGTKVPPDIVNLLDEDRFRTMLRLTVAVNEDILLMPSRDRDRFIGKDGLISWASRQTPSLPNGFTWNEHVSWVTVFYWYNRRPDGNRGSTWVADNRFIYLGSFAPLDDDKRIYLLDKLKNRE